MGESRRNGEAAGARPALRDAERPVLELLGLAARARSVASGTESVRRGVRDGKVVGVVLASDAAAGQRSKLIPLLEARRIAHHVGFTREQLGQAIGRTPVSAIGITNPSFARRVAELMAMLPSRQE